MKLKIYIEAFIGNVKLGFSPKQGQKLQDFIIDNILSEKQDALEPEEAPIKKASGKKTRRLGYTDEEKAKIAYTYLSMKQAGKKNKEIQDALSRMTGRRPTAFIAIKFSSSFKSFFTAAEKMIAEETQTQGENINA